MFFLLKIIHNIYFYNTFIIFSVGTKRHTTIDVGLYSFLNIIHLKDGIFKNEKLYYKNFCLFKENQNVL